MTVEVDHRCARMGQPAAKSKTGKPINCGYARLLHTDGQRYCVDHLPAGSRTEAWRETCTHTFYDPTKHQACAWCGHTEGQPHGT